MLLDRGDEEISVSDEAAFLEMFIRDFGESPVLSNTLGELVLHNFEQSRIYFLVCAVLVAFAAFQLPSVPTHFAFASAAAVGP